MPTPDYDGYGFRWQVGQGIPNALHGYLAADTPPGLYVIFRAQDLAIPDLFGDGVNVLSVFAVPAAAAPGVQALITQYQANPPPGQADLFQQATGLRVRELSGLFDYVTICLNAINAVGPGQQLLSALNGPNCRQPTFIAPSLARRNQIFSGIYGWCEIARQMFYLNAMTRSSIAAMVDAQYAGQGSPANRYRQFAADLNTMPLYSLFVQENNYSPNFLGAQFLFRRQQLTFQMLMNWLVTGFAVFQNFLETDQTASQGLLVNEYFRDAVIALLYTSSPPGPGQNSTVECNTCYDPNDPADLNRTRPPAIGLAHELVHAMHNAAGTNAGADIGSFTTTLAELLAVGLGPFQNVAISENAIRAQWPPNNPGLMNNYAPGRRTIYEAPGAGQTPASMRAPHRPV